MKYANESAKGARRAAALKKPEPSVRETASPSGQHVNPAVCIGPLQGEQRCSIPINSPAYTGKFKR
jgi:hypothetical protein